MKVAQKFKVLLTHNLMDLSGYKLDSSEKVPAVETIGTIFSNLLSYGYVPSEEVAKTFQRMNDQALKSLWAKIEPALRQITGTNLNMGEYVVYKNFPQETLSMSESEYWIRQIFIYLGIPSEYMAQEEEPRSPALEQTDLKVIHLASEDALEKIFDRLCAQGTRWTDPQNEEVQFLLEEITINALNLSTFGFKENGLSVIAKKIKEEGFQCSIQDATDVLRLAALVSGQEVTLPTWTKFKSFKRAECRMFLRLLEDSKNLLDDMSMRQEMWKRFLSRLHVSDYKFKRVKEAYNTLYRGGCVSFEAGVNLRIKQKNVEVLDILATRPGVYARRFHELYSVFGTQAVNVLNQISDKLNTLQIVKLIKYLETINYRKQLIFAPKGNWTKAQIVKNKKTQINDQDLFNAKTKFGEVLTNRLAERFPEGVMLDERLKQVKLQTNDQKLASYGRGTTFDIPENIKFVRSGSYWEVDREMGTTWYDNGWCFYGDNFAPLDACAWNSPRFNTAKGTTAAQFSGDPVNSHDVNGRACQMIDLYLDELDGMGVRYAVWNTLCYSGRAFNKSKKVVATLQWGENQFEGELYDAKRAQMVFDLEGDSLTKYIAMVDIKERKLVYLDANFYGEVETAIHNVYRAGEQLKAYIEYMESLPSVHDLMAHAPIGKTQFLLDDKEASLVGGEEAYVFKPLNEKSVYTPIDVRDILDVA